MPPKKKQPFMCFINHIRNDPSNRNRSIPDLTAEYGEVWKTMSADQRRPFLEDSRSAPEQARRILTTIRTDALKEEEEEMQNRLYEDYLDELAERVVDKGTVEELMDRSFFILAFNVMCKDAHHWYANEIGLVEFTINSGIMNSYHEFIDSGEVPMGYARKAKEHSETTHKIPWIDFAHARGNMKNVDGSKDIDGRAKEFEKMVLEIFQMLNKTKIGKSHDKDSDPMIVFCLPEQFDQVKGCLKFMCDQTDDLKDIYRQIELLDIVKLLANLCARINKMRPYPVCEGDLKKSTFDYTPNTNCNFHEEHDCKDCALGLSKRLAFLMADILCEVYKVTPIPNKHLPQQENNFIVEQFVANTKRFNYVPKKYRENSESEVQTNEPQEIRPPTRPPIMSGSDNGFRGKTNFGVGRGIRRN